MIKRGVHLLVVVVGGAGRQDGAGVLEGFQAEVAPLFGPLVAVLGRDGSGPGDDHVAVGVATMTATLTDRPPSRTVIINASAATRVYGLLSTRRVRMGAVLGDFPLNGSAKHGLVVKARKVFWAGQSPAPRTSGSVQLTGSGLLGFACRERPSSLGLVSKSFL